MLPATASCARDARAKLFVNDMALTGDRTESAQFGSFESGEEAPRNGPSSPSAAIAVYRLPRAIEEKLLGDVSRRE